eukprot:scaffold23547_cov19-Tisochrysis_lutea.AAC.2
MAVKSHMTFTDSRAGSLLNRPQSKSSALRSSGRSLKERTERKRGGKKRKEQMQSAGSSERSPCLCVTHIFTARAKYRAAFTRS